LVLSLVHNTVATNAAQMPANRIPVGQANLVSSTR
jgi:hypothetical protein